MKVEMKVEESEQPGLGAWWMVFVLFTYYAVSYIDRTIVAHLVDPMQKSLGLGDFAMGLVLGPVFAVAYSAAALPAGWIVDRFDRRIVVGGAMMFWSLMTIACGIVPGIMWLVAARAMVAVGEAFLTPAAYALIMDRFPQRRVGSALAFFATGAKAGSSLAFFAAAGALTAAGALATSWFAGSNVEPWKIVFFLVGLPGLALAFLPLTFKESRPRANTGKSAEPSAATLLAFVKANHRFVVPFLLGIICVATVNGTLLAWLPAFMQRTHGWSAAQYGPPLGLLTAIGAILTIPQGIFVDWLYSRGLRDAPIRYMTWVLALAAPAGVAAFYCSPWGTLACVGIIYTLVLPYIVYMAATVRIITPDHLRGRFTALIAAVGPIFSQGLGPMVIGILTDFVFDDPQKLGTALAIVVTSGIVGSFLIFRLSLSRLHEMLAPSIPGTQLISLDQADRSGCQPVE